MNKHYCEHGHHAGEIRRLPLGEDSGLHLCQRHYHAELEMRCDSGAWDIYNPKFYPAWELLKIVTEE